MAHRDRIQEDQSMEEGESLDLTEAKVWIISNESCCISDMHTYVRFLAA